MSYAHLSLKQLQALANDPQLGGVAKRDIAAELEQREQNGQLVHASQASGAIAGQSRQPIALKSTNPRAKMTQVERRMADILDMRLRAGEIVRWWAESLTVRIGVERTTYRPDFVAQLPDGSLEIIEVKGGKIWDDARAKFQAAALQYPFARWRMLQWVKGEWRTLYDYSNNLITGGQS